MATLVIDRQTLPETLLPLIGADRIPAPEERLAKKQEAFQNFTRYCGVLPADFNYHLELSEYRNERYGHID